MARLFVIISLVTFIAALPQGQIAGNGYSGATGTADGGESLGNGGLLNILSNNGGPGGNSASGDVLGGDVLASAKSKGPKKWDGGKVPRRDHECAHYNVEKVDNGLLDVIIGGGPHGDHLIKRDNE